MNCNQPTVQLTIIEDQLTELIALDIPGQQVVVGSALSDSDPQPLGTASPGSDEESSRANHIHAHGNQDGGTLHQTATSEAAGFMSALDKLFLDDATSEATPGTLVKRDGDGRIEVVGISIDEALGSDSGGTGQTTYDKGDLLAGTETGELAKVSAGADDLVLIADSLQPAGVRYGQITNNTVEDAAGIEGTKIVPDFGDQDVVTTGNAEVGDLVVNKDLTVEGDATFLKTQLLVEDKNIELGYVDSPTDAGADGGGLTLKGTTDKTFTYSDATDSWDSSENINIDVNKTYNIAGDKVLSYDTLGESVVNSSLRTVGNIIAGTWNGDPIQPDKIAGGVITGDDDRLIPAPKIFYVRSDGDNLASGLSPGAGLANIEEAFERIENFDEPEAWTVAVLDNLETDGNLDVPDNTTVVGVNFQRRSIIRPTTGNENNNVFRCGNGSHIVNLKFTGWEVDDFDDPTGGFAMTFRPGAVILPGGVPYGQNCVVTSVATEIPTPLPNDPTNGNPAHPKGGGCVLADASVLSPYSVFPNIMTWGFTPSSANGLGYVAKNRGFINPVNAIGVGAHRHFMCLSGGQMVVTGSSSQFGDYSFWSEGSTMQVVPLRVVDPSVLITVSGAGAAIASIKEDLITAMWAHLVASFGAGAWPSGFEAATKKDAGLFIDAIAASLVHGFERPMLNFAEGMFDFEGNAVYTYAYHGAFKGSWDKIVTDLQASSLISSGGMAMVNALVARLKLTMDNYWYEIGTGPAPASPERVRRKLRSLITAINHQWTAPLAGVEFYKVPPAKLARSIRRSIVQKGGGRVKFSGQDDGGNAVFVGGLEINARSGQLGGPPFDAAVRGRITRAVLSRSY